MLASFFPYLYFSRITGRFGDKRNWFAGERSCDSKTAKQFEPHRGGIKG